MNLFITGRVKGMIKFTCIVITDTSPMKDTFCRRKMEFSGCSGELERGVALLDPVILDMF